MKKGAVEVQFNWIFVFVVGAMILLLGVGFVQRQRQASETRIAARIVRDLNSVILHSSITPGKSEKISLPEEIVFSCKEPCSDFGCDSEITVKGSDVSWETPTQPIFSPGDVESTDIITWSQEWSVPFRVCNFLYVTSPTTRYVFVGNKPELLEIYNDFPPGITKEQYPSFSDVAPITNYRTRIITYNEPSYGGPALKDVSVVKIVPTQDDAGKVEFYVKRGADLIPQGTSKYLGEASLYGAIFSKDSSYYNCSMKKAMLRLGKVSTVYLKKIQTLETSGDCVDIYEESNNLIYPDLLSYAENLRINLLDTDIYATSVDLSNKNHNLKIYSCPLIY